MFAKRMNHSGLLSVLAAGDVCSLSLTLELERVAGVIITQTELLELCGTTQFMSYWFLRKTVKDTQLKLVRPWIKYSFPLPPCSSPFDLPLKLCPLSLACQCGAGRLIYWSIGRGAKKHLNFKIHHLLSCPDKFSFVPIHSNWTWQYILKHFIKGKRYILICRNVLR